MQVDQQEQEQDDIDDTEKEQDEEIQVDFDFCSIQDNDYFGILNLVKQIFGDDGKHLHFLRDLTSQILSSNGTVVKVDDSDPYAVMSIIDLSQDLVNYFNAEKVAKYLKQCCWLINDRLINMPPQLVPNLLRLVMEEIRTEKEFVLYFCKMGRYVESPLELEVKSKKRKIDKACQEFYFQPEDEILQKYAIEKIDVEFDQHSMSSDARRTFHDQGIVPFRKILIIKSNVLADIQAELTTFLQ